MGLACAWFLNRFAFFLSDRVADTSTHPHPCDPHPLFPSLDCRLRCRRSSLLHCVVDRLAFGRVMAPVPRPSMGQSERQSLWSNHNCCAFPKRCFHQELGRAEGERGDVVGWLVVVVVVVVVVLSNGAIIQKSHSGLSSVLRRPAPTFEVCCQPRRCHGITCIPPLLSPLTIHVIFCFPPYTVLDIARDARNRSSRGRGGVYRRARRDERGRCALQDQQPARYTRHPLEQHRTLSL
jgi:hypothetical protein